MTRHKNRHQARGASEYEKLLDAYAQSATKGVLRTNSAKRFLDNFGEIIETKNIAEIEYDALMSQGLNSIAAIMWNDRYGKPITPSKREQFKQKLFYDKDPTSTHILDGIINATATAASIHEWCKYRQIYRFEKDIADAICQSDAASLPIDTLEHLPYPSLMLQCQNMVVSEETGESWDKILVTIAKDALVINIVDDNSEHPTISAMTFMMSKRTRTVRDMFNKTQYMFAKQRGAPDPDREIRENLFMTTLALLAYIASSPDDITTETPAQIKGIMARPTPKPTKVADHDTVNIVGETVVRQFVKSRDAYERERASKMTQHHRTPAPHMRRAHWHHFWTGPRDGERKLVCHWVPPTFVNAKLATGEMRTTINVVSAT